MFALTSTLSLLALAASAVAQLTVNTPNGVVACEPILITWSGGQSPYFLDLLDGNNPTGGSIQQLQTKVDATSFTWNVDQAPGKYALQIRDINGDTKPSAPFDVAASPSGVTCGAGSGSSSSASSVASSASSAVSSVTSSLASKTSSVAASASSAASSITSAASASASSAAASISSAASSAFSSLTSKLSSDLNSATKSLASGASSAGSSAAASATGNSAVTKAIPAAGVLGALVAVLFV